MRAGYEISEVISKVKKLLALAAKGGTEAEAIAAAEKAQYLVERYNLSLSEAELGEEAAVERDSKPSTRIQPHAVVVARTACKLFDCDFYYHGVQRDTGGWRFAVSRSFRFVGLPANVEGCLLTFNYLLASIDSLLDGSGLKTDPRRGRADYRAYRIGCAKRLHEIASAIKQQRIEHGGDQTQALVLLGQQVARRHIESLKLKGGLSWNEGVSGSDFAFSQGYEDGDRIDIHGARTTRMLR